MSVRNVSIFEEQAGVTGASDSFLITPTAQLSVVATPTAAGSATLQLTVDPHSVVEAGNAVWVDAPSGSQSSTFAEASLSPVTGVRLNVASGTWTLKALQVEDLNKRG